MEDLSALLYKSIVDDNCEELRRLISNGADVNQVFEDIARISTKSILHMACEKGRTDCVKVLLENGAKVNARDPWGMTPLRYCIAADRDEVAGILIKNEPDIADSQDKYGKSVLHAAVEEGSEKFVRLLLDLGADPNISTDFGVTPLMMLMSAKGVSNYYLIMNILLENGADVHLRDLQEKRSALHHAAITKKVDAVELLLKQNADPNVIDTALRTPLTSLICYNIPANKHNSQVADDVMTIVILLTQSGTYLNVTKTEFSNPLIMATYARCPPLVRFFLDYGADVNITFHYNGLTPLLLAVKQKDIETIRALLNWNCRLDVVGRCRIRRNDYEFDPFQLAVNQELWGIVELLVFAGYNTSKHQYLREAECGDNVPSSLKNNIDMLNLLRLSANSPNSLLKCCTLSIYKAISSNISEKVDALPLPVSIQTYLKICFL